jgi:hypothetical protein
MVKHAKRILLVEGLSDESFYSAIIKKFSLNASVVAAAPGSLNGGKNSKNGAINLLEGLLQDLFDGNRERIALVVDADWATFNQGFAGFENTVKHVVEKIKPLGYIEKHEVLKGGGLVFEHNDGLPPFGLWVMPNNNDQGALEDWIKTTIVSTEKALFNKAVSTVAALDDKKFKPHQQSKAELATWLAWQKKPGEGLYYLLEADLLDSQSHELLRFVSWLKYLFD